MSSTLSLSPNDHITMWSRQFYKSLKVLFGYKYSIKSIEKICMEICDFLKGMSLLLLQP